LNAGSVFEGKNVVRYSSYVHLPFLRFDIGWALQRGNFMTKKLATTLVALAFLSFPASGPALANGVDFQARCGEGLAAALNRATCESFINGVVAGIAISPHPFICFPPNYDWRQGLPIVKNWMRANPDRLNWAPAIVIRQALRESYPCGNGIPLIGQ